MNERHPAKQKPVRAEVGRTSLLERESVGTWRPEHCDPGPGGLLRSPLGSWSFPAPAEIPILPTHDRGVPLINDPSPVSARIDKVPPGT